MPSATFSPSKSPFHRHIDWSRRVHMLLYDIQVIPVSGLPLLVRLWLRWLLVVGYPNVGCPHHTSTLQFPFRPPGLEERRVRGTSCSQSGDSARCRFSSFASSLSGSSRFHTPSGAPTRGYTSKTSNSIKFSEKRGKSMRRECGGSSSLGFSESAWTSGGGSTHQTFSLFLSLSSSFLASSHRAF